MQDNDSEDDDGMIIRPDDSIIVCDVMRMMSVILRCEFWKKIQMVKQNMYVYHALIIHALTLYTAWLDCPIKGGEIGNFIGVGSMDPATEIWDIDIVLGVSLIEAFE